MNRLTHRDGCYYDDMDTVDVEELYSRLEELENKLEDKQLLNLPCKAGDTIYVVEADSWHDDVITSITIYDDGEIVMYGKFGYSKYYIADFGHTVFLSEAEAKVASRENN